MSNTRISTKKIIEENDTELHDEVGEISIDSEYGGVIYRYITENET